MANYLIIKDDKVVNVIVADTREIAEQVTGLEAIEETAASARLNWTRSGNVWIAPEETE